MVTFDARQPGTAAATWRTDARWTDAAAFDTAAITSLVVIAAHPDDETLGAGGIIAACAGRGIPITVVIVTDGAASDAALDLPHRRADEARAAVSLLAPAARLHFLGFADGATREHRAAITAELAQALAATPRHSTVLAPWRGDGHRDHRVVGEIVAGLVAPARLVEYPIWMWHWGEPDHPDVPWQRMRAATTSSDLKRRALSVYTSQTSGDEPTLSASMLEHFSADCEFVITDDSATTQGDPVMRYLERAYARRDDPWRVSSRWYEKRKRALTLASLPAARYGRVLELGCSIGVLTGELAERCDDLVAVDLSQAAVDRARLRLAGRAGVTIQQLDMRTGIPTGPFDLVVLSEVGYYLAIPALEQLLDELEAALTPNGTVIACHWRHPAQPHVLTGDEVHEVLNARGWRRLAHHVEADFVLDVVSRDGRSVAQREGIV